MLAVLGVKGLKGLVQIWGNYAAFMVLPRLEGRMFKAVLCVRTSGHRDQICRGAIAS